MAFDTWVDQTDHNDLSQFTVRAGQRTTKVLIRKYLSKDVLKRIIKFGGEAEALAQLQEEALDAIDDGLLQIALAPVRALVEPEELETNGSFSTSAGTSTSCPRRASARTLFLSRLFARRSERSDAICRSSSRLDQLSRAASIS